MFSFFTTPATVQRQQYVDNKSTFIDLDVTYKGYFKTATLRDVIDKERIGREHHFTTVYAADIQDGDILVINGEKYNVKAVSKKRALNKIVYTLCILVND